MARYLPIVLGVLLIVGLTIPQFSMTDRLSGTSVSAQQRAELLNKVPLKVGDWIGEERSIDEDVRKTAGAIGAVSRPYRNSRTGEQVDLWLIVGHARDVSAHTPDICYPGQGFETRASENSLYTMVFPPQPDTPFLTNTFFRENVNGRQLVRVFWTWFNPDSKEHKGKVIWEAPTNARWHFGNARGLHKMYFTSEMRDPKETAEQSSCVRFARDFLPEVSKALGEVYVEPVEANGTDKPASDTKGAESLIDAPKAAAPAAGETPTPSSGTSDESAGAKELIGTDPPTTPSKSGP